jgi:hypothetical protein
MNKKIVTLILEILIGSYGLLGQNYQTINSKRTSLFMSDNENIKCIRIDSVRNDGDSIFYPLYNIIDVGAGCYTPYQASWLGDKVLIRSDGYNIFFNLNKDSIKINTKATAGESWNAYQQNDTTIIFAKIISIDTLSFIGLKDSVKTIEFQAYDTNHIPIESFFNAKTILISKNYGIIKTLNFAEFSDIYSCHEFNLAGITNPQKGIKNLTAKDIFNFDIGDEIHIKFSSDMTYSYGSYNREEKKSILKYINKENKGDSIIYDIEYKENIMSNNSGAITYSYLFDTIKSIIVSDTILDKLPGEPIYSDIGWWEFYMFQGTNNKWSKVKPAVYSWKIGNINDTCFNDFIGDDCLPDYVYIEGLGGPYYWCEFWSILGEIENSLVYYKKGGDTWGTPLIITNVIESDLGENYLLYPNPSKNYVNLNISPECLPCNFLLFDIYGKLLMDKQILDEENIINIEDFSTGMYFYILTNNSSLLYSGKLLIK